MAIQEQIERIGVEEYINCILVESNVRPAFMIQPQDYGESYPVDPITNTKLKGIKRVFPGLKQTITAQGVLISKRAYSMDELTTNAAYGVALGYSCAADFEYIQEHRLNISTITYSIVVVFKESAPYGPIELYANVCKDASLKGQQEEKRAAIEGILQRHPYFGPLLDSVLLRERVNIPESVILRKLVSKEPLTPQEKMEIKNILYNIGFKGNTVEYPYDDQNDYQRGILVALVTYSMHTPLAPFYPLQRHPEHVAVDEKTEEWEDALYASMQGQDGGHRRAASKMKRKTRKRAIASNHRL